MDIPSLEQKGISVIPEALLSEYTTFRLGGPCKALIACLNAREIITAVTMLRETNTPFIIIGSGSNILASDKGVDTVIIRYTRTTPLISRQDDQIIVDAATPLNMLAEYAVNAGLDGMTTFSGIPGTVGGAIAGNAGAYGNQISDPLLTLTVLTPENHVTLLPASAIHFEYRDSSLKHDGSIILSAAFRGRPGDKNSMQARRKEIIQTRESKHGRWEDTPCAGSFFRNVEPTSKAGPRQSAGWFIEQCGANTLNINGAHSYVKHANIITRDTGAAAKDVYDLTLAIAQRVKESFGISLIREVRVLGMMGPEGNPTGYW
jgi:UDP-N-acetylmuramate dehydrogenase